MGRELYYDRSSCGHDARQEKEAKTKDEVGIQYEKHRSARHVRTETHSPVFEWRQVGV